MYMLYSDTFVYAACEYRSQTTPNNIDLSRVAINLSKQFPEPLALDTTSSPVALIVRSLMMLSEMPFMSSAPLLA